MEIFKLLTAAFLVIGVFYLLFKDDQKFSTQNPLKQEKSLDFDDLEWWVKYDLPLKTQKELIDMGRKMMSCLRYLNITNKMKIGDFSIEKVDDDIYFIELEFSANGIKICTIFEGTSGFSIKPSKLKISDKLSPSSIASLKLMLSVGAFQPPLEHPGFNKMFQYMCGEIIDEVLINSGVKIA